MNETERPRPLFEVSPASTPDPGLSRTTTRKEPTYGEDETAIPSVRPVVDAHDRLWAEMDVLDDAAELARQVKTNGSFFGPAHAEALANLRNAQIELAQMTAEAEKRHDRSQYRILWEYV
jgi:hypothetical protein